MTDRYFEVTYETRSVEMGIIIDAPAKRIVNAKNEAAALATLAELLPQDAHASMKARELVTLLDQTKAGMYTSSGIPPVLHG